LKEAEKKDPSAISERLRAIWQQPWGRLWRRRRQRQETEQVWRDLRNGEAYVDQPSELEEEVELVSHR
jgi:hypothetical protein